MNIRVLLVIKCYMMMIATISSYKFLNLNELEEGGNPSFDATVGVKDPLHDMRALPSCFKTNTNFTLT